MQTQSKPTSDLSSTTIVPADGAALIWSPQDGFTLAMPDYPDDALVPHPVALLAAILCRIEDDPDFVDEMLCEIERAAVEERGGGDGGT